MCVRSAVAAERVGVADVVRAGIESLRKTSRFPLHVWDVFNAILACRTGRLGGRRCRCRNCGKEHLVPHSCRNRHCPRCQGAAAHRWLEKQKEALLPVPYFHVVFTLPHELNPLIRNQPRELYRLLFASAAETLLDFGRNNLGAQLGITAVLHTWGQTLCEHYHVHCIVTGGGLDQSGESWIHVKRSKKSGRLYLFPVQALSKVFRGKYLEGLRALHQRGELVDGFGEGKHERSQGVGALLKSLREKGWVVYCKEPFAGPDQVLAYLSRYTHRVAIGDGRILNLDGERGKVDFRYKNYRQGGKPEVMTLEVSDFVKRLGRHILPKRFTKIRHYGILSTRNRKTKVARCRELLGAEESPRVLDESLAEEEAGAIAGPDLTLPPCPHCGRATLEVIDIIPGSVILMATRGPPVAQRKGGTA